MDIQHTGGASRRRERDSEREVLVGVRVPESFHRRILSEGRRREATIKEMVIHALKVFFRNPIDWDGSTTVFYRANEEEVADEQLKLIQLWTITSTRCLRRKWSSLHGRWNGTWTCFDVRALEYHPKENAKSLRTTHATKTKETPRER